MGDADYVRLVIFDDAADVEEEAAHAYAHYGNLLAGPGLVIDANPAMGFPQTEPIPIVVVDHVDHDDFMGELTLDELVIGDDDQPELLRGSLSLWPDQDAEGVSGPFEAGFCLNYQAMFWGE